MDPDNTQNVLNNNTNGHFELGFEADCSDNFGFCGEDPAPGGVAKNAHASTNPKLSDAELLKMANANPIRVSGKVPGPPCNALCRLNVVLASWGIDARASANSVAPSLNWPIVWPTKPGLECSAVFQACVATEPSASDYAKHWAGWDRLGGLPQRGRMLISSAYSLDNADQFKVPAGRPRSPWTRVPAVLAEAFAETFSWTHSRRRASAGGSGLNDAFIYGHIAHIRSTGRRPDPAGARQRSTLTQASGVHLCATPRRGFSGKRSAVGRAGTGLRHHTSSGLRVIPVVLTALSELVRRCSGGFACSARRFDPL